MSTDHHDLLVVGTGFASSFFLRGWLANAPATARILVLERGPHRTHANQLAKPGTIRNQALASYTNTNPDKPWRFALGFGGGSQCWWACTPRHMPNDFRMGSTYGVGTDWPVTYDDLEPYYTQVEAVMQISGSQGATPFPMSAPYPLPPHTLSDPDKRLLAAFPDRFFPQPTARPSQATGSRPKCCANGVCHLCPIDSKWTVQNGMMAVYDDPRVTLVIGAFVTELEVAEGSVQAVRFELDGKAQRASADLVALGCNAIFNSWLLLRSGLDDGLVGRGLTEQRGKTVSVQLDGVDAYQGSTSIVGHAYHFADGPHRSTQAAAIVETLNIPLIQEWRGHWREKWRVKFLFEDLPQAVNRVEVDPDDDRKPRVVYEGASDYLHASADDLEAWLTTLLAPLPVRDWSYGEELTATEAHLLCTHPMGTDPATSVVDAGCVHHTVRNLVLLGGGNFPTAPPANPSLTISALALRTAQRLGAP